MSSFSYVVYTGDGGTGPFSVPFSYLSKAHVSVTVNGAAASFAWAHDGAVTLTAAAPSGALIEIRRATPKDVRLVDFTDGSVLTEADLDMAMIQQLYIAQEVVDAVAGTIGLAADGSFNAQNRRVSGLAEPTAPTDAVTKGYLDAYASTAATSAASASNSAAAAAASASGALAAEAAADLAQEAAEDAQDAAETARDQAQTSAAAAATSAAAASAIQLNDGGVTTSKIADAAVTGAKIAAGAVAASHLAPSARTGTETALVSGAAGPGGALAAWDADGDLVAAAEVTQAEAAAAALTTPKAWSPRRVGDAVRALSPPDINSAPDDVQVFDASGTWTKPAEATAQATVRVRVIGGGGGGGGGGGTYYGGGGQGGDGLEVILAAGDLGATEAVVVGAGGAGGVGADGAAGGQSRFGAVLSAGGGEPGRYGSHAGDGQGGGGAALETEGAFGLNAGGGGAGGRHAGQATLFGGGASVYGGGGGGGGGSQPGSGAGPGAGGPSLFGGAGGDAGSHGAAPGGGGGGGFLDAGSVFAVGSGAAGRVTAEVWYRGLAEVEDYVLSFDGVVPTGVAGGNFIDASTPAKLVGAVGVTFARGSAATVVDGTGLVTTVGTNTPRFAHTITGAMQGLLLEPERTNIAVPSEPSSKSAGSLIASGPGPDGASGLYLFVPSTSHGQHYVSQVGADWTIGDEIVMSFYAKAVGYDHVVLRLFNASYVTPPVFNVSAGSIHVASETGETRIEPAGNGYFRCIWKYTMTKDGGSPIIYISDPSSPLNNVFTGDGVSGVEFRMFQTEIGATVSSPIATSGASATRAADAMTIDSAQIPSLDGTRTAILVDPSGAETTITPFGGIFTLPNGVWSHFRQGAA